MGKIITLLFLCMASLTQAQDKGVIAGIVLDNEMNNEPLVFASISIKGSPNSVQSDMDGAYTIDANVGTYTLVINFMGYKKIEVPNVTVKADEITSIKNIIMSALEPQFSLKKPLIQKGN